MNSNHTPENSHLGQSTSYPKTYSPDILYAIPRALGRKKLALPAEQLSIGMDWWHVFELSWLNRQGISQVAMARLAIVASSEFIIESKSLKLYLNGLNFTEFDNQQAVKTTIEKDLSDCLKLDINDVSIEIFDIKSPNQLSISQPYGQCIDTALDNTDKKIVMSQDVDASSLQFAPNQQKNEIQWFYSHLLRSNCPVTNQPDWGTVQIAIDCLPIDKAGLLRYILTYRQHNGFHEQCVEQIFSDLTYAFAPKELMVRAWYTRRGGIDINPCRVSKLDLLPSPSRLNRQ